MKCGAWCVVRGAWCVTEHGTRNTEPASLLPHLNPQLPERLADLVLVLLLGDAAFVGQQRDLQPVEFVLQEVHHAHQPGDLAPGHGQPQVDVPPPDATDPGCTGARPASNRNACYRPAAGVRVLRTDQNGTVVVTTNYY